eukprot:SAG31_NODE_72_length_27821_cov_26.870572_3_plen_82_part_00
MPRGGIACTILDINVRLYVKAARNNANTDNLTPDGVCKLMVSTGVAICEDLDAQKPHACGKCQRNVSHTFSSNIIVHTHNT